MKLPFLTDRVFYHTFKQASMPTMTASAAGAELACRNIFIYYIVYFFKSIHINAYFYLLFSKNFCLTIRVSVWAFFCSINFFGLSENIFFPIFENRQWILIQIPICMNILYIGCCINYLYTTFSQLGRKCAKTGFWTRLLGEKGHCDRKYHFPYFSSETNLSL